ncbi:MAG: hypothetical protein R3A79_01345 [Nannocystaceae bacterium]
MESTTHSSHGGILFQLEMFRPTMMAAVLAEGLASKARNILDATLELARHPRAPIVVARLHGSVVGDDPAEFWRENADLAIYASQVLPRQCFIYYVRGGLDRREGFIVAQQGQVLVAHDATPDSIPEGTPDNEWPVRRLCQQMQLTVEDIADAFPGGPRVSISLAEPTGDDQQLLMTLAGQADDEDLDDEPPPPAPRQRGPAGGGRPGAGQGPAQGQGPASAASKRPKITVEEDAKRRSAARAAEMEALAARSAEIVEHLPYVVDALGAVVAPDVELEETEILSKYAVSEVEGSLPDGLPASLREELQGKAIDFAVRVDFLSEVFVANRPLSRPDFEAAAADFDLGGETVKILEVFAPRLGAGSLLRKGKVNVFISRRPDEPIPAALVAKLLG